MSHLSSYSVKEIVLTSQSFQLLAKLIVQALRAHGYNVSISQSNEVEDYYGRTSEADIVIQGSGDVVLERGIGLRLKEGKPELVADFYGSNLKWLTAEFENFCIAADYANAVIAADPTFELSSIEVRGKESKLQVASSGFEAGGDWWI